MSSVAVDHQAQYLVQAGRRQPRRAVAAKSDPPAHAEKACDRCGMSFPLFYFPRRASQPDGRWVHCFGCRYELKLVAMPYRQCAIIFMLPRTAPVRVCLL